MNSQIAKEQADYKPSVFLSERNSIYQIRMSQFYANMTNQLADNSEATGRPKPSISPINTSQVDSFLAPDVHPSNSASQSPFVPKDLHFAEPLSLSGSSPFVPYTAKQSLPINKHLLAVKHESVPKIQFQSTPNKQEASLPSSIPNDLLDTSVIATKPSVAFTSVSNRVNFHSIHELAQSSSSSDDSGTSQSSCSLLHETASSGYGSSFQISLQHFESQKTCLDFSQANKENISDIQTSSQQSRRKQRTSISKQQKEILEYAFKAKPYPDSNEVEYLCQLLGFDENVIRIWFQNKRARSKQAKHH